MFILGFYSLTGIISGTGEHGVGVGKKEYLNDELGEGTVSLMKRVKNAIDPSHIMNPGKVSICWGKTNAQYRTNLFDTDSFIPITIKILRM